MQEMGSRVLNGFDNVYIPTKEVKVMAGRRPMFDIYIQRAIVAWTLHYPEQPFSSTDIQTFMKETKMQLSQSRGSMTVPVIANRLAFWEKKGMLGLVLVSSSPNHYIVKKLKCKKPLKHNPQFEGKLICKACEREENE